LLLKVSSIASRRLALQDNNFLILKGTLFQASDVQ